MTRCAIDVADLRAAVGHLNSVQDEGPEGEGWKSDDLKALIRRLNGHEIIASEDAAKGVTAWSAEVGEDDDPLYVIATFHHGLGRKTRIALGCDDADEVAAMLTTTAKEARQL